MDMRQFCPTYLKPDELRKSGGQQREVIADIRPPEPNAKFPKPIAVFVSGKMLPLNRTSVGNLMAEFDTESDRWIGKHVLLIYRSNLIDGKETEWIDCEPANEDAPPAPPKEAPKPKPKLTTNDPSGQIPF